VVPCGAVLYAAMRFARAWLPVIIWSVVILSASTDAFSSNESRGWLASLIGPALASALNIVFRKLGHIIGYGILGILARRADRRVFLAIGIALLVAITDETRQSMTLLRTGSPWDVMLDVLSAWLGILVMTKKGMWRD
jgi:VanZ family protein